MMPVMIIFILTSGMTLGYELGIFPVVFNGLTAALSLNPTLTPAVAASSSLVAGLAAFVSGFLADYFGRRALLFAGVVLLMVGILESSVSESLFEFVLGRILFGFGLGTTFVLLPLYLIECTPAFHRGRWMAAYFLAMNSGIFIACFAGFLNQTCSWRFLIALGCLPMLLVGIVVKWMPESPRWAKRTAVMAFWDERNLRVLILGMIVNIFAQAVGAHAIVVYATLIMQQLSLHNALSHLTVNSILAFALMIGAFLSVRVMDVFPRRRLLLLGMSGMATSLALMSWVLQHAFDSDFTMFIILVASVLFLGCQGFSLAPIASLLPGELFSQSLRGLGMGICISAYWITNTIVVYAFPHMLIQYGAGVSFLVFLLFTILAWIWFYFNIPETNQVALEVLEQRLQEGHKNRELGIEESMV